MHKYNIKKIVESNSKEQMLELEEVLIELIDYLKISDYDKYKEAEYDIHKILYHDHIGEDLAKKWVSKMKNKDGSEGEHWTLDQTSQYASGRDKYDFYVVLNMMYSDYYNPKFDDNTYIQLAKDWLDDKDIEDKLLNYYFYVVCND